MDPGQQAWDHTYVHKKAVLGKYEQARSHRRDRT
jgi:hypothetical protein